MRPKQVGAHSEDICVVIPNLLHHLVDSLHDAELAVVVGQAA